MPITDELRNQVSAAAESVYEETVNLIADLIKIPSEASARR